MRETPLSSRISLAIAKAFRNIKLFRNNVGAAWIGKTAKLKKGQRITIIFDGGATQSYLTQGNERLVIMPRRIEFGLFKGSADKIGWTSRTIKPEDVGKTFAQFTSVEVKTPTGRVRPEQKTWGENVERAGGIHIVARSEDEAVRLLEGEL